MSGAVCDCGASAPWPCAEPDGTCAWYPDGRPDNDVFIIWRSEESEESDN